MEVDSDSDMHSEYSSTEYTDSTSEDAENFYVAVQTLISASECPSPSVLEYELDGVVFNLPSFA